MLPFIEDMRKGFGIDRISFHEKRKGCQTPQQTCKISLLLILKITSQSYVARGRLVRASFCLRTRISSIQKYLMSEYMPIAQQFKVLVEIADKNVLCFFSFGPLKYFYSLKMWKFMIALKHH